MVRMRIAPEMVPELSSLSFEFNYQLWEPVAHSYQRCSVTWLLKLTTMTLRIQLWPETQLPDELQDVEIVEAISIWIIQLENCNQKWIQPLSSPLVKGHPEGTASWRVVMACVTWWPYKSYTVSLWTEIDTIIPGRSEVKDQANSSLLVLQSAFHFGTILQIASNLERSILIALMTCKFLLAIKVNVLGSACVCFHIASSPEKPEQRIPQNDLSSYHFVWSGSSVNQQLNAYKWSDH